MAINDIDMARFLTGYHPVSASSPGYELYYLNVMAGSKRARKFRNDPDHDWLMKK